MKTNFLKPKFSISAGRRTLMLLGGLVIAAPLMYHFAAPAFAQTQGNNFGLQVGQLADYAAGVAKSLNLTDAQKTQLKAIAQKYAPQVHAIVTNKLLSNAEKKTRLQALHTSAKAEVDAVLTPAQVKKIDALRATAKTQITALLTKISQQLQLTDTQKTEIKGIMEQARLEAATIITDPKASRSDKRTQLVALRTKTRGEIASVLTPEQQKKAAAIGSQIRSQIMQRIAAWRKNGGFGFRFHS